MDQERQTQLGHLLGVEGLGGDGCSDSHLAWELEQCWKRDKSSRLQLCVYSPIFKDQKHGAITSPKEIPKQMIWGEKDVPTNS